MSRDVSSVAQTLVPIGGWIAPPGIDAGTYRAAMEEVERHCGCDECRERPHRQTCAVIRWM